MSLLEAQKDIVKCNRSLYINLSNTIVDNLTNDSEKIQKLSELVELIETTVKNEHLIEAAERSVYPIQEHFHKNTNNNNDDFNINTTQIEKEFDSVIEGYKNKKMLKKIYENDVNIRQIKNLIKEIKDGGENDDDEDLPDEDITATQETMNMIDPISKKLIVNPVRHTPCGHVYDKESTLMMIKQRKRKGFRCPYMGCEYRQPINPSDLEEALDYKREINRRKRAGTYVLPNE